MPARRILIVDDDPDIREVVQVGLETVCGWEVVPAESGAKAIELAQIGRFDAMLLDVMMPGMDGIATFRQIRSHPATREIPVIIFTAKVQSADREQFEGLGVDGVIVKPFDPLELGAKMAAYLGWEG